MFKKIIILGIFVIPFALSAQTISFDWLLGKWQLKSEKVESYEEWQKDGDRFIASSYRIKDGQKIVSEYIFLENFSGQWAYIAKPKGQSIALFALLNAENDTYTFENKEHDFPQRIIYKLVGQELHASIEGEISGELKGMDFHFTKIE